MEENITNRANKNKFML